MKNNVVKMMIAAALFTLPVFGGTLMARDHHHKKNTAVEIINAVARLLNPAPVVVAPAPPPVVVAPAPQYHKPAPPPRKHHAPAPAHRPAPPKGGHRR